MLFTCFTLREIQDIRSRLKNSRTVNRHILLIAAFLYQIGGCEIQAQLGMAFELIFRSAKRGYVACAVSLRMMQTVINRKEYCHQTDCIYSQHQEGRSKETLLTL